MRDRWEALNALLTLAQEMEEARHASMLEFVQELEERAQLQNAPEMDGVTLSSLHAASSSEEASRKRSSCARSSSNPR